MRRMLLLILIVPVASLLMSGCGQKASGTSTSKAAEAAPQAPEKGTDEILLPVSEQAANQIVTETAGATQEPELLRVPGRITLSDKGTWHVGVMTEGRVEQVLAGLGDYVKEGQVLARMHSHEVHDSRAAYFTSVSELTRFHAAAQLAKRNFERMQRLRELKAASQEQAELARQELTNAEAALRNGEIAVQRSRQHLEENLGVPAEIPSGHPSEQYNLVPIRAPASGYILAKNVTPGTVVQPSTEVFTIGDTGRLWMVASIRQELLGKLRVGQKATVTVAAFPQLRFQGPITNLGQQIDPVTRLLNVRIELGNPDGRLRPEMLANAEIPVGDPAPMILVPVDALQQVNEQNVIFVQTGGDRFRVVAVRAGDSVNGRARVLEGLKGGERIVTHGSFILKSQLLKTVLQGE